MTINQQFPASVSACRQLNVEQQSSEYPPRAETALSRAAATEALDEIQSWPGYGATPLHRLTKLETLLGCGEIHYKMNPRASDWVVLKRWVELTPS